MTSESRTSSLSWGDLLREKIQIARSRLLTRDEFGSDLQEVLQHPLSPIASVQLEITRPAPHDQITIGSAGDDGEPASFPVDNFDDRASCRIRTWYKAPDQREMVVDFPSITSLFSEWARAFWKTEARDVTGLLRWQDPKLRDLLNTAVRDWSIRVPLVSGYYADLDNFKAANDKFGQNKGDDVIQSFGALLERIVPSSGLVVRQGGDEFLIFLPTVNPTETLQLARLISYSVSNYEFETGDVRIGVAVGVSTGTRYDTALSAEVLAKKAEKGVKPGGDASKLRGRVRFAAQDGVADPSGFTNETRDLAAARVKTSLLGEERLEQPWLDLLSAEAEKTLQSDLENGDEVRAALNTLTEWAAPEWAPGITRLGTIQPGVPDRSSALSRLDAAMAVAHGIFRGMLRAPEEVVSDKRVVVRYTADLSACQTVIEPRGTVFFSTGECEQFDDELDLGAFFTLPADVVTDIPGRRPVFVHIGYEHPPALLDKVFDRTILVDTRPSASGGLPDFWASTVANLISAVSTNPNVPAVYVMGDLQHGIETVGKLNAMHSGTLEPDRVGEKTGLALWVIRDALPRLQGKIFILPSLDAVYEHIVECLRDPFTYQQLNRAYEQNRPILDRPLLIERLNLTREDGCRVRTINEAFPIVLEIARTSQDAPIRDQAGRAVRELIDFKVHLTTPLRDQIPDFYRDEADSFEQYFQREFLEPAGLFGKWFQFDDQLPLVVRHVAEVITQGRQFATRRAVLVIPHQTQGKASPSPLGLISVRIIPRFVGEHVTLTFSYTWRTVEALVGFPYSIYGSVRYSQFLADQVKQILPEEQRPMVRIKDISYVAHSLHFFVDEYGQQIARKIVNDATS